MNPLEAKRWQDELLDQIFTAVASSQPLTSILVFKGARVLARHIPEAKRQSLDIDANCSRAFLEQYPLRTQQAEVLATYLTEAIRRHFESQSPVRHQIEYIRVTPMPPKGHPLGWNAFEVRMRIIDLSRPSQRGVPTLQLDIAYPEALTEHSTAILEVDGRTVVAYTLERIAGEKLRAYLSSLPAYQAKIRRHGDAVRVKDLYDLTCILRHCPLDEMPFWQQVGYEFRVACESRGVDCEGWPSFAAGEEISRATYAKETVLPRDISFDEAWDALREIVASLERQGITPLQFDLPTPPAS